MPPRRKSETSPATLNPASRARSAPSWEKYNHSRQLSSSPDRRYAERYYDDDDGDAEDNGSIPKDERETQLEKLLFGDAGFQNALKSHEVDSGNLAVVPGSEPKSAGGGYEVDDGGMAHVDDADLFFLDAGPGATTTTTGKEASFSGIASSSSDDEQDSNGYVALAPAWEDSDDERLRVSLAGSDRLRKLRVTEAEDVVSGKEYAKRLRRQFERLQPAPEWAVEASDRCAKRRRTDRSVEMRNARKGRADEVESDSDQDMRDGNDDDVEDDDGDNDDELSSKPLSLLLQNSTSLTRGDETANPGERQKLREEVLDIQRLKDVGGKQPSSVDSLTFHPHYPLLLSSGPASTLFLHHVSTESANPNPLVTSLHVRRTPIRTSAFSSPTGDRIFFAGRRRYFHIWDLDSGRIEKINGTADRREEQKSMERFKLSPCGRWMGVVGTTKKGGGIVTILDATTLQWIAQVRIDSRQGIADFAWWADGEGMCAVGKNGEVSEWDGRQRRVIARWVDEGAVGTTVLSLGGKSGFQELGGDRWVAIGSSSGIVNIYDRRPWAADAVAARKHGDVDDAQSGIPRHPKPTRMLDQLTTPTSHIVFANDGQFLVVASRWKRDALRLVHLPSGTVYRNWPTANTPFGRISAVAISPNSRTLAVGNEQGKIRLWEIRG